jgi:moderate conductance mechanosensitive channel
MHPFLFAERVGLFAEGRFMGKVLDEWIDDAQEFLHIKLPHLILVAIIAFVLNRLLHVITARMISVAERHAPGQSRVAQVRTLAGVIRATGLTVIGAIVSLQFLAAVGVNLAPLLTSAGIAGVAIGLAAQNIVRDVFNGILILVEDQFNVGDSVRVAGVTGIVEAMTLRKTIVRDIEGTLYVIPNSQIATVANLSVGYSVAVVNVSVDFSANPDKVVSLLKSIATELRNSEQFREVFVEDPQVLGVEAMKGSEVVFPVVFKTQATRQFEPVREFRRRVRLALEENNLLPGDPYRVFRSFNESGERGNGPEIPVAADDRNRQGIDPTSSPRQGSDPFAGA